MHVASLVISKVEVSVPQHTANRHSRRLSLKALHPRPIPPLEINYSLVLGILKDKPKPEHTTFLYPHTNRLPTTILLFYVDLEDAHAATKLYMYRRPLCLEGIDYLVSATISEVALKQLRAFAKVGKLCKWNVLLLPMDDLVAMFMCRDARRNDIGQIHMHTLCIRLEEVEEKLKAKVQTLKAELVEREAEVDQLEAKICELEEQVEEFEEYQKRDETRMKRLRARLAKTEAQMVRSAFSKSSRAAQQAQSTVPQHSRQTRSSVGHSSMVSHL